MIERFISKFIAPIFNQLLIIFGVLSSIFIYLSRRDARIKKNTQLEAENKALKAYDIQNQKDIKNYDKFNQKKQNNNKHRNYIINRMQEDGQLRSSKKDAGSDSV